MNKPTQDEIAQRARKIWQDYGSPAGRDTEIWFEAERQLGAASTDSGSPAELSSSTQSATPTSTSSTTAERVKGDAASESMVENLMSPPVSNNEAVKAAIQKKEARAPKTATKSSPKAKPAESGKPLWDKPHSS